MSTPDFPGTVEVYAQQKIYIYIYLINRIRYMFVVYFKGTEHVLRSMSHYGAPPECNIRIVTWRNPIEGLWRGGSECSIRFVHAW